MKLDDGASNELTNDAIDVGQSSTSAKYNDVEPTNARTYGGLCYLLVVLSVISLIIETCLNCLHIKKLKQKQYVLEVYYLY